MKAAGKAAAALVVGAGVAVGAGSVAWQRWMHGLLRQMGADTHRSAPGRRFHPEQLVTLPAPVQRYFAFALSPAQPLIASADVESDGEFRMKPDGGWHAFTATQHYSADPRGFIWDASINIAPFIDVRVADSYINGEGALYARAASIIPVVNEHGTPELAAGELLRYLAEAVVMPTALLPSSGVVWSAVDDSSACASMTDRGTTVSATFHFGLRDEIVRVSALRYRDVAGTGVLTPWVGHFRDYKSVQGMMVPMFGEVAWMLPSGMLPYYRGRTKHIVFELAA